MKPARVEVKVELDRTWYRVGEAVSGSIQVRANVPVKFKSMSMSWETRTSAHMADSDDSSVPDTCTLISMVQPVKELEGCDFEGEMTIPINYVLPPETPATVDPEMLANAKVVTILTVAALLREPEGAIVQEYPLRVVQPPKEQQLRGILQSIEFDSGCRPNSLYCCCSGICRAHIELPKQVFTSGEPIEATVVVDTQDSRKEISSISVALRRVITLRRSSNDGEAQVDEYEMFEGPRTEHIPKRTQTTLTVCTKLPKLAFVPDVDTSTISIKHFLLVFFRLAFGHVVETQIPLVFVPPETMRHKEAK